MPFVGQRVRLRALEQRDLDLICEAYQDFDLQLTTDGDAPPLSDQQVRAFWEPRIAHPAPDMRYFAIEPLSGNPGAGQFAGMCNLHDIDMRNRHAELGTWLRSAELRGRGYGTDAIKVLLPYAFEVVRLEKVYLGVYDFNESGLCCYERIGFRYEGRLRHQIYYRGRYWDEWPMRMLDGEWDVIQRPPAEGLRPYHPADQAQAVALIQRGITLRGHLRSLLNPYPRPFPRKQGKGEGQGKSLPACGEGPQGGVDPLFKRPLKGAEAARAILRHWWRRIDYDVLSVQREGQVIAIFAAPVDEDGGRLVEIAVSEDARSLLTDILP